MRAPAHLMSPPSSWARVPSFYERCTSSVARVQFQSACAVPLYIAPVHSTGPAWRRQALAASSRAGGRMHLASLSRGEPGSPRAAARAGRPGRACTSADRPRSQRPPRARAELMRHARPGREAAAAKKALEEREREVEALREQARCTAGTRLLAPARRADLSYAAPRCFPGHRPPNSGLLRHVDPFRPAAGTSGVCSASPAGGLGSAERACIALGRRKAARAAQRLRHDTPGCARRWSGPGRDSRARGRRSAVWSSRSLPWRLSWRPRACRRRPARPAPARAPGRLPAAAATGTRPARGAPSLAVP